MASMRAWSDLAGHTQDDTSAEAHELFNKVVK